MIHGGGGRVCVSRIIWMAPYIMTSGAGILSSGDGSQADKDSDEDFHFSTFLFNNKNKILRIIFCKII